MKIKIMGTGAAEGIPGVFCTCPICENARKTGGKNIRMRSQSIINDKYLIDFPPEAYLHSITNQIRLSEIEHVIITHPHEDHFYPKEFHYRKPPFGHNNESRLLNIYGSGSVAEKLREFPEIDPNYVRMHTLQSLQTLQIGELLVTALPALHARDMECFIYIIESEGKRLLYGHDSGFFPEPGMARIKSTYFDCVILDTTTGLKRDGKNHMGVEDNITLKAMMQESGCADEKTIFVMSHFSHNGKLTHEQLEEIGARHGFRIAFDGFETEF
jgi:phosphoribosyl 1,2-cyclic phosphate phosphodiesterase